MLFAPHIHRLPGFAGGQLVLPTGPVDLNGGHPLANGLVALYAPGLSLRDLVFPQNPALTKPSAGGIVSTPFGPGWNSPASASGSIATSGLPVRAQSQTYTLVWFGKTNGSGGTADQSIMSVAAAASPFVRAGLFFVSSAGMQLCADDSYTGSFAFGGDGHHPSDFVNYGHIAATYTSGAQSIYLNGAFSLTVANHSGTLSFNTSTDNISFGDSRAGPGVTTVYGFIYNRVLSAAEILTHALDPFQMLRPAANMVSVRRVPSASAPSSPLIPNPATASGTSSATLTRLRALTPAAAAAAGAAAGTLLAVRALTAAGAATGSASGALARSRALIPAGSSAAAQTGSLTRSRPLTTAPATAATTQAAALHAIRALLAAGTATGTAAASLARRRALLGAATALSSQTGSIAKFTQGQLTGQGVATGTAAATLHAIRGLTAAGSASTSQAATLARSRGLATAAGAASGSQAATLRRSRRLTPAGATATTGQAAAQSAVRALVAAGAATGTAQAAMTRQRALRAAGTAASGQTAAINVSGFLPAPSLIPAGNTITIPLDSRTAAVPLDTRTVTIPF